MRAAKAACGFVVVSVFVNPAQFGPHEDFDRYPRTLDADRQLALAAGADAAFAPAALEIYPDAPLTRVSVGPLAEHLCGRFRPGHFGGVALVVLKLLNIVLPDVAVFGAKDGQQARIIRRMAHDLNAPVTIQIEPTVREPDGLALSSRHRYLTAAERAAAPRIYEALAATQQRAAAGERDVAALETVLRADLTRIPGAQVEYASVVSEATLQPVDVLNGPALAAAAVYLGATRLIDNVVIPA